MKELFSSALNAVAPYLVQILLGVIVALIILSCVQTVRLAWTKKDLQASRAQNEAANAKITAQNEAIRLWQAEGERARQQAEQAQQAAVKVRAASTRKVARLQAEPVPVDCEKAAKWAAEKAAELAEAW